MPATISAVTAASTVATTVSGVDGVGVNTTREGGNSYCG